MLSQRPRSRLGCPARVGHLPSAFELSRCVYGLAIAPARQTGQRTAAERSSSAPNSSS